MPTLRLLARHEIEQIWQIDRSEVHHHIYQVQNSELVRVPAFFEVPGWPPEQIAHDTPMLYACFDRGGAFTGAFKGQQLIGVVVLDTLPLGPAGTQRQLKYLYVSRPYRGQGVGMLLFGHAQITARAWGVQTLYISATPTEGTVDFYLRCGAERAPKPDPALLALEPEDIHLVCSLAATSGL